MLIELGSHVSVAFPRTKIEEANAFAPQHSRIFKEMILVANSSKPFPMTPKNTVMRKAVVALYDSEIEACYEAVERSANVGSDIEVPTEWDQEQTLAFVRRIVTKVMERKEPPADEVDLFQVGLDSLQATYVRNSILSALRSAQIADVSRIAPNVVFEHPTIASLSKFLTNVASAPATANGVPDGTTSTDVPATHIAAMQEAIERYTKELPVHKPDDAYAVPKADEQVVILTGSTGGLGSHLLAQLVQKSTVKKVYALNRKSAKASLEQRQLDVLKERLGDEKEAEGVIGSEKVTLVEATLEREDLGISKELFEEVSVRVEASDVRSCSD